MCKSKVLILIFIFSFFSFISITNVEADYINTHICDSSYGLNFSKLKPYAVKESISNPTSINNFTAFSSDGHVVYCTEKGVSAVNRTDSSDNPNYVSSASTVENSLLAKALAYGYYSESSSTTCTVDKAATQLIVWFVSKEVADGTKEWRTLPVSSSTGPDLIGMLSGSNASAIANKAAEIRSKVLNHDKIPSFSFTTSTAAIQDPNRMELKYVEASHHFTNSVTDSTSVFSGYTLGTNPTNITATKSGNKLTITSKNDSVTTPVSMSKVFKTGGTVYKRNDGVVQGTAYISNPSSKTVTAYVGYKYQDIGKGIIELHKIDKYTGKNMKGATFNIYSDDTCTIPATDYLGNVLGEKTSDKNGKIVWKDLYYPLDKEVQRIYYVKETKAVEGYAFDNEQLDKLGAKNACIPVVMKAQNEEVTNNEEVSQAIYNIPYGNITILKQDEETGKVIEGVEFQLLKNNSKKEPAIDINGQIVQNVITDSRGIAEFENIPYGDYIIVEVKTNSWYKPLIKPLEFTLDKSNDALKYSTQGTEAIPEEDEPMIPLEKYKLGDPTNDGKINNDDLAVIENIINDAIEETPLQFYASDLDKNLTIDATDKEMMEKYIAGDTTVFTGLAEEDIPGQIQKRVTLSITNKPIDMKISKLDIVKEKEIKGAKIVIKNAEGEVFLKYTSTTKAKEFYIPIGDYTLTETVAPKGYQKLKTEIKFRVLSDGNIKLLSVKSSMYKLEKSKEDNDTDLDHLKIYNNLKEIIVPDTGSVVSVIATITGVLLIGGGAFVIYKRYNMN